MEAFRNLVAGANGKKATVGSPPKDKLAATKARERDLKDAHKAEAQRQKEAKDQEKKAQAALLKEERQTHDTKRAAKDARDAARREEHRETGQTCEHGVHRCRICFPVAHGK